MNRPCPPLLPVAPGSATTPGRGPDRAALPERRRAARRAPLRARMKARLSAVTSVPLFALLLAGAGLAPGPANAVERIDDTATWLAGLQRDPDARLSKAQQETEAAWERLRTDRLAPMAAFARRNFPLEREHCDTLFYPFGGPDILNALGLFPACRRYILFGLEPIGELPALARLDAERKGRVLDDMHKAQQYILRRNFFVTQYMNRELNTPNLKGVLPLLATTLARMGYEVLDAQTANLDGRVPADPGGRPRALQLHFRARAGGPVQELVYASFDASDSGLERRPGFLQFMAPIEPTVTLMKAASYLLFEKDFSRMRALVASRSRLIVQDDSGLPYAELRAQGYAVELFGDYVGTIPQFRYRYQKDLAAAYAAQPGILRLPFDWSYAWRPGEASMQVARRAAPLREAAAAAAP